MSDEVLRVAGLRRSFKAANALENVSFSLAQGERLAVLGPSGSGKTTLLRLIAGLEAPDDGEINLLGKTASRAGQIVIAPEHREVALVFQGLALFPHLNALDQICFASRGRGGITTARRLLESIGLGHRASARLDQLSGGERQRIALARALAQEPKFILMDEPFASLDEAKRAEMRDLLKVLLRTRETTLILVTHFREDAFDIGGRFLILDRGKPVANDSLARVLANPRHAAVVRALGLGQVLNGEITAPGTAETTFGTVSTDKNVKTGPVLLLIRPGQPRLVQAPEGVEVEVVSSELRPTAMGEVGRVVVVSRGGSNLRFIPGEQSLAVGNRVRIRIEGECERIEE